MAIADSAPAVPGQRKKVQWSNIALGGIMNLFEVSTLFPPLAQWARAHDQELTASFLPPPTELARVQVTTLGQPLEVIKTQMASARGDTMKVALDKVWARGGVLGCENPAPSFMHPTRHKLTWVHAPRSLPGSDPVGVDRGVDEGRCAPVRCCRD